MRRSALYTWATLSSLLSYPRPHLDSDFRLREWSASRDDKSVEPKSQEFFILQIDYDPPFICVDVVFVFSVPELFTNREIIFILSINF